MEWPACATLTASATARCVLPTPGGPSNNTFSCRERNVRSNRLMTCVLSRSGWNAQSYSSMVFTNGSEASFSDVAMRRSSLDATSRSRTISSTESGERLSRSRLRQDLRQVLGGPDKAQPPQILLHPIDQQVTHGRLPPPRDIR